MSMLKPVVKLSSIILFLGGKEILPYSVCLRSFSTFTEWKERYLKSVINWDLDHDSKNIYHQYLVLSIYPS